MKMNNKFALTALIIITIQGTTIASQTISSFITDPTTLGKIRWIESIYSLLLLLTCFGMPTLALRESTIANDKSALFEIMKKSAIITTSMSVIVIFFLNIYKLYDINLFSIESKYLIAITAILIPASITKTTSSIIQGQNRIQEFWKPLLAASSLSIITSTYLTYLFKTNGWILGKIIHEILFLSISAILYKKTKSNNKPIQIKNLKKFAASGFSASTSLIIRSTIDNCPILILGYFCKDEAELGFFGVASLIMFAPNLIISIHTQKLIPEITQKLHKSEMKPIRVFSIEWKNLFFTSAAISIATLVIFFTATSITNSSYEPAKTAMFFLAAFFPIKSMLNLLGGIMISIPMHSKAFYINLIELTVVLIMSYFLEPNKSEEMTAIICTSLLTSIILNYATIKYFSHQYKQ